MHNDILGSVAGDDAVIIIAKSVESATELEAKIKKHNVKIGILTVPIDRAQEVADKMVVWGIKAIWNFTPLRIRVPDNIVVQNVHLGDSLLTLTYGANIIT